MVMKGQSASVRAIARSLGRCISTISREVQRNPAEAQVYSARRAGELRSMQRRRPKLATGSVLFDVVRHYLQEGWSPEQISDTLKRVFPDDSSKTLSHETIYKRDLCDASW